MMQGQVQLISIDQIAVINPRVRNKKVFREIVANIAEIGLKKPITVASRPGSGELRYDLICGQGRLEAYQSLGQREIPAFVVEAKTEDCLVMSLVENLARRHHRPAELLHDIEGMKKRGYRSSEIATKTGLSVEYVRGVCRLIRAGEHRLLRAVETGQVPVTVAVQIVDSKDTDVQSVLQEAYEQKLLRGQKLAAIKRLVVQRQQMGKGSPPMSAGSKKSMSLERLLQTYRDDTDKKRILVRKAEATRSRLMFVTEALRKLFSDVQFVSLLKAEGLATLPAILNQRIRRESVQ